MGHFIYLFIWMALGLCCCTDFSLVAVSRGYSSVSVQGLLTVVASAEPRRSREWAQELRLPGSGAQAQ